MTFVKSLAEVPKFFVLCKPPEVSSQPVKSRRAVLTHHLHKGVIHPRKRNIAIRECVGCCQPCSGSRVVFCGVALFHVSLESIMNDFAGIFQVLDLRDEVLEITVHTVSSFLGLVDEPYQPHGDVYNADCTCDDREWICHLRNVQM